MRWKGTSLRKAEGSFLSQNCHIQKNTWGNIPIKPIFRLTSQRWGFVACDEEVCWQILTRECKVLSFPESKRERQEICSSVINASEKSEQRVTSPQLITTRGKGKTNHYPDPVIYIWAAPIVLLARLCRSCVFLMLRGIFLACFPCSEAFFHAKHVWGQTPTYFTWMLKEEPKWTWGQVTVLPHTGYAAGPPAP